MNSFVNKLDRSPLEVVLAPTIFVKDSFMRLKRERLGPIVDLKEVRREQAVAWAMEAEEENEGDTPRAIARMEGKKTAALRKRKQAALGSSSSLKSIEVHFANFSNISFLSFWYH